MVNNYWVGGAAADTDNPSNILNWASSSGGVGGTGIVPDATTDCIFDANGNTYACTFTATITTNTWTVGSGYTQNFSQAGFALNSTSSVSFDGTGTLTLTNSAITISGDGNFHLGSGVGTASTAGSTIDMQGTGNYDCDKTLTRFDNANLAYSGKTITITGSNVSFRKVTASNGLHVKGGTLTLTTALSISMSNAGTPYVIDGGSIINGVQSFTVTLNYTGGGTSTVNGITLAGSGSSHTFAVTNASGNIMPIDQQGDISAPNINISSSHSVTTNWTTNNYGIAATRTTGTVFNFRGYNLICGSSTIASASMMDIFNSATTQLTMNTSTWNLSDGITIGATAVVTAATSTVNFIGTLAASITSGGKTLATVVVNKSAAVNVTQADALACATLTTQGSENYSSAGFALVTSGSQSYSNTGTLTLSGNVTITGNGSFIIASGVGAVTLTSSVIDVQGTGSYTIGKAGLTFPSLKFSGNTKTVTVDGAQGWTATRLFLEPGVTAKFANGKTYVISSYTAGDWDGTNGNLVDIQSTSPGDTFAFTNPASMSVSYVSAKDSVASNAIDADDGTNTDAGNNTSWTFLTFTAIDPATGTQAGGTSATITGSGFKSVQGDGSVTIGGSAASIVSWSNTSIDITTPSGTPGNRDVVITNSDGTVYTATNGFFYLTQPVITSVDPSSGPDTGGTSVTVSGSGFLTSQASGAISGINVTSYTSWADDEIIFVTDVNSAGLKNITVTNDDGLSDTSVGGFNITSSGSSTAVAKQRFKFKIGFGF